MRNYTITFPLMLTILMINVFAEEVFSQTVFEIAQTTVRPAAAPRYSDVCLSSRWKHPRNDSDPHDTFRDAAAFHATRLDWVYSFDPAWIRECRDQGFHFGGALNTILTDTPWARTREKGRILDKEGNRIAAPWMKSWNGYWGCVNSLEYRGTYLAHAIRLVDGGVDTIQMDDPGINLGATQWGGCYCVHCQEKAEAQGLDLAKDMGKFQKASVVEFYSDMRNAIDAYAGLHVPFSSNNYGGRSGFPYDLFEYGMAELHENAVKPEILYTKFKEAAARKSAQIFTLVTGDTALTRRAIATAYASGGHVLAPYDVYHGSNPRIFGDPTNYADIFGFVRANELYLDGYEDAAVFGNGLNEDRYGVEAPIKIKAESVYAFCRVRPGEEATPIVIHLVDWRKQSQPFTLNLRSVNFYPGKKIAAELITPAPYDAQAHARAETTKNYAALKCSEMLSTEVQAGNVILQVPSITPWALLVLTPE